MIYHNQKMQSGSASIITMCSAPTGLNQFQYELRSPWVKSQRKHLYNYQLSLLN